MKNDRNISAEGRKKMSEGGKKGGEHSHGGTSSSSTNRSSGSRSDALEGNKNAQGPHNVSPEARKKMSEGGRKGGSR